jgi:hypothetical protein
MLMSTIPEPTMLKRDVLGHFTTPFAQRVTLLDESERSGMKGASLRQGMRRELSGLCFLGAEEASPTL